MNTLKLLAFPLALAIVACNNGGDDKDTDETDVTSEDETTDEDTDVSTEDDTDVSTDDTDDTDVEPLTIDVSEWSGDWTVIMNTGGLCGGTAPETAAIAGTSATTFTLNNGYGTATCTFSSNTDFACDVVTYENVLITSIGTWDGNALDVNVNVNVPGDCNETSNWTVTPPAPAAEPQ